MRHMVVHQDSNHSRKIVHVLESSGYGVDYFNTLAEAGEALRANHYDLILMGRTQLDGNSIEWVKRQTGRGQVAESSFVIVMAEHSVDRIEALEVGADDSVSPDINARELIARVRALLRRPHECRPQCYEFFGLELCRLTREVRIGGVVISMQRRETAILESLMRRAGRVVPRASLEHDVYGAWGGYCPNSLEVRISRIRRQLLNFKTSLTIQTIRGVGYRLAPCDENKAPSQTRLPSRTDRQRVSVSCCENRS
ncbi:response regulator transcription factor [Acetobacter sacchari]|uniref:Response regulator transcription factor n=1 Tax=Acetobacter sacchari TaxID=2661687 RepID=A0ABS3LX07_9PROT|nr:response regulator transcription factor [Acetobacter sacchari]MBO1360432.1 response regulator transcription factor [Acetobacter sacchari]